MVPTNSVSGKYLRRLAAALLAWIALVGVGIMFVAVASVVASIAAALTGMIAILAGGSAIVALWRRHPAVFRGGWQKVLSEGPVGMLRLAVRFSRDASLGDLLSVFRRRNARAVASHPAGLDLRPLAPEPWMQPFRAWRAHTAVHLQLEGKPHQAGSNTLIHSGLFEPEHYRQQLPAEYGDATTDELAAHYLSSGWRDDLEPSRGIRPSIASLVLGIHDSDPLSAFLELCEHTPPPPIPPTPAATTEQLQWFYLAGGAWSRSGACFVRVIGNDLPPRHASGQSMRNVRFILDNERLPQGVTRHWLLNRITDPAVNSELLTILEDAGESVLQLPFVADDYRNVHLCFREFEFSGLTWDADTGLDEVQLARAWDHVYRDKNRYVMNNNGARNFALVAFRGAARWVFPWDGNTFLTESAWSDLLEALESEPWRPAFVVPMARITDNAELLADDFRPSATEEPQVIFRSDVLVAFDESYRYGRRPKVELLLRLGVPGPWDRWSKSDPWEAPLPTLAQPTGWRQASYVARLASGESRLEKSAHLRVTGRREAVRMHLHRLDVDLLARNRTTQHLLVCDESGLAEWKARWLAGEEESSLLVNELIQDANRVMLLPPPTVGATISVHSFADVNDYVSLGPPWALYPMGTCPELARDNRRPPTLLRESLSDGTRDDRWAVQRMFDETILLTLAATFSESSDHWRAAAQRVRAWFVEPQTRMNPHLKYARVQPGKRQRTGIGSGILDFQDVYLFLDAVQLLQHNHHGERLSPDEFDVLQSWFVDYLSWLSDSPEGKSARASSNAHGPWYDLQHAAIAAWLGDFEAVQSTIVRASERAAQQLRSPAAWKAHTDPAAVTNRSLNHAAGWQELALALNSIAGVSDSLSIKPTLDSLLDDLHRDSYHSKTVEVPRGLSQQHRLRFCLIWHEYESEFSAKQRLLRHL
jgi:hypothetical protein